MEAQTTAYVGAGPQHRTQALYLMQGNMACSTPSHPPSTMGKSQRFAPSVFCKKSELRDSCSLFDQVFVPGV